MDDRDHTLIFENHQLQFRNKTADFSDLFNYVIDYNTVNFNEFKRVELKIRDFLFSNLPIDYNLIQKLIVRNALNLDLYHIFIFVVMSWLNIEEIHFINCQLKERESRCSSDNYVRNIHSILGYSHDKIMVKNCTYAKRLEEWNVELHYKIILAEFGLVKKKCYLKTFWEKFISCEKL